MEMERERQREWEESQKGTAGRKVDGQGVDGLGGGIGGKWDVNRKSSLLFGFSKVTLTLLQNGRAIRVVMGKIGAIWESVLGGDRSVARDLRQVSE